MARDGFAGYLRRCASVFFLVIVSSGWSEIRSQTTVSNGDINGSGVTDISDVIALAQFLFLGGSPPVPLVCEEPAGCEVEEPASSFESQYYRPLDLEQAAREQYGLTATLVSTGEHLYDWKAQVGRDLQGLDLKAAVADQYGPGWTLVMVGATRFDWKAFRFEEPDHVVLPAMLVASDRFSDIEGVASALARFRSVLGRVQSWYNGRVDGSLRFLRPLILPTGTSSEGWNQLSSMTAQQSQRFVLLDAAIQAYEVQLPEPGGNLRVVLSIYSGDSPDVWLGAASRGRYAMAPPRATSLDCPDTGPLGPACADAAYAVGHEFGHTLGLGHSCDDFPGHPRCADSIMQVGKPPEAVLLQHEACLLLASPFFHPVSGAGGGGEAAPQGMAMMTMTGCVPTE